ncbi:DNA polymerase III subunit delta [Streptococcus porcinus]|uniref:DNA polymerase III subunit delta n=1 Tax=Streptococcus porcinus TaxID=1340 RepID=UPI0010CABCB6|nr:DNA polymerase III subunit delta [Streptococcus porcinus]VTS20353.1 DNA polymerase III subunit delta [Streptococcus porcinus]
MIAIEKVKKLSKDKLGLITLVTGDDLGQFSQIKEEVLKAIAYNKEDLAYSYFDLSEGGYSEAEMDLLSLPFFADSKVVIFDHFVDITTQKKNHLKEDELKSFESYLEKPLGTTKLIIFAPGKLDGKRRIVKLLKRDAEVIEALPLKEVELKQYFQSRGKEIGLIFDSGVFDKLLLKSNGDFSEIAKNLLFLKTYKGQGNISLEDVDEAIPKTLNDNIFDLSRFILQGSSDQVAELVHDLRLAGEDEIKLIAILLGQFRLYLQIKLLLQDSKNEQQIVLALSDLMARRVNPYQVKFAIRDSQNLSIAYLEKIVKVLIETDYQIKKGVNDKTYLFDLAILKLMIG